MRRLMPMAVLLVLALGEVRASGDERRFEFAPWMDHFDYHGIALSDGTLWDTQTPDGVERCIQYCVDCGATTIYWRDFAGAIRSGEPRSADNDQIDADLARAHDDSHPEAR